MSFLVVPTLSTPLLKIPLLVAHAACTYHGMTPPTAPASHKERKKATDSDYIVKAAKFQRNCTATSKLLFCGIALAEVTALLAHQFPSTLSDRILTYLLPTTGTLSLRLTPLSVAGCLLSIAGGLTRAWCHHTLGRFFTWEVAVRDDHKLLTSGPYAIVRHPSYTGWFAMLAGNAALLASAGSYFTEAGLWDTVAGKTAAYTMALYLTWISANLFRRTFQEDDMLRKEFGVQWDEWAKRTPYRLIPFIF